MEALQRQAKKFKIGYIYDFLFKNVKHGTLPDVQINKIESYGYLPIKLNVDAIKKVFGKMYDENIVLDSSIFAQFCYALQHRHFNPTLVFNVPINIMRAFDKKFVLYAVEDTKVLNLLSGIGLNDFILWAYDNIGLTVDGIVEKSQEEWCLYISEIIKNKLSDVYNSHVEITAQNIKIKQTAHALFEINNDFEFVVKAFL
jgi:hypothetical protein